MLRRHGGDVRAERAEGGGAVFLVCVPLCGSDHGQAVGAGG
jgi:signal transduction histidine kinase